MMLQVMTNSNAKMEVKYRAYRSQGIKFTATERLSAHIALTITALKENIEKTVMMLTKMLITILMTMDKYISVDCFP